MPSGGRSTGRRAKLGGLGGSLGASIRNERFERFAKTHTKEILETDIPKNAHLVPEWEKLTEEAVERHRELQTSVVDENDLTALLRIAELSDRDFTAERQNARVVMTGPTCITQDSKEKLPDDQRQLPIPMRPAWSKKMRKEQVDANEKEAFLEWRRELARIEENFDVLLTPFEKNLEFWRQLWRVVEKSDVVVQVVDARNPLLYRSPSLEGYVKSVGEWKTNVILFNKADLLPHRVRVAWGQYFDKMDVKYFFFAAKTQIEARLKEQKQTSIPEDVEYEGETAEERVAYKEDFEQDCMMEGAMEGDINSDHKTRVMNAEELLDALEFLGRESVERGGRQVCQDVRDDERMSQLSMESGMSGMSIGSRAQRDYIMIGFVGYPNVGKSSTINALLGQKRVGVTSTPGKTKHFQTLIVSDSLMLCDCPGLVFPSVVSSRAEMVCGGILPLNSLKDHISPMELVSRRIPRIVFEECYNIVLPSKTATGAIRHYISWTEICQGYAVARGLITGCGGGVPDTHTAARKILKDYVDGRLRFCHMPPGQQDIALGPLPNAREDEGQDEEGRAEADAASSHASSHGGADEHEAGVAIGQVKKNRRSRENRGLSAGAWVEDDEANVMKDKQEAKVFTAGGKKKGGKNFIRVERPYSAVAVRPKSAIPMA